MLAYCNSADGRKLLVQANICSDATETLDMYSTGPGPGCCPCNDETIVAQRSQVRALRARRCITLSPQVEVEDIYPCRYSAVD